MSTKLIFERTRNNQELYRPRTFIIKEFSGISEMAPLQSIPGEAVHEPERVLLEVDEDFDIDTSKLGTVKEFSGIAEFVPIVNDNNSYMACIDFLTLLDDDFKLPDNCQFPQAHQVSRKVDYKPFVPKTSNNKLVGWHRTTLDPAFKVESHKID